MRTFGRPSYSASCAASSGGSPGPGFSSVAGAGCALFATAGDGVTADCADGAMLVVGGVGVAAVWLAIERGTVGVGVAAIPAGGVEDFGRVASANPRTTTAMTAAPMITRLCRTGLL